MTNGVGRDMRACPDLDDTVSNDENERHTLALITQTLRGEVAVVDMDDAAVIDQDPSIPGREFLQVGANPTAITSTPGGIATFVGVREDGRDAIFALPTTCIAPPSEEASRKGVHWSTREVSLWSACRLPSAPGEMVIAADPTKGDGSTTTYRTSCGAETRHYWKQAAELGPENRRKDCAANLEDEQEVSPAGRRKLVVTLPEQGLVAIYDAQAILNLPPGSFENCVPDRVIKLSTAVDGGPVTQEIPSDIVAPAGCTLEQSRYDAIEYDSTNEVSLPAGVALADRNLYIADHLVPVIHNVDLGDPCLAKEIEPLRPVSFDHPKDAVFTDKLAVSSLLPSGKRYLYATVHKDGSAMAFDVSPGATSRAPIVRERAADFPHESPDRIRFDSPIAAMSLITHDVPAVRTSTGTAEFGVSCDPHPDAKQPGSLYRANSDFTSGAAPRKLRGLFGMMALDSGQIAAIDIEDWDAPCRRPATNNTNPGTVDWLGCSHDAALNPKRFEAGGNLTVTDEVSCNISVPHRVRSSKYILTDSDHGANSPNLSRLPIMSSTGAASSTASLAVDRDRLAPKMLAVPFEGCKDKVCGTPQYLFVGTTKYEVYADGQSALPTDPKTAEQNSLLLPLHEPRIYGPTESFSVTYEGIVLPQRANGRWVKPDSSSIVAGMSRALRSDEMVLLDADAQFCDQGIEDADISRGVGKELNLSEPKALDAFANTHGDMVVLKSEFDDTEIYFDKNTVRQECGGGDDLRRACEDWFGTAEEPTSRRELLIREAYHNQLVVTPRLSDKADQGADSVQQTMKRIHCCFPAALSYEVRAAQQWVLRGATLRSNILPGPDLRCVRDCNPKRSRLKNRVFEITSNPQSQACATDSSGAARPNCFVGPADKDRVDTVCALRENEWSVNPEALGTVMAKGCVLDSLKARFAIYRGLEPSVRDMAFTWTVNGGFTALAASMTSVTNGLNVMPADMKYIESWDSLGVVDGESGGFRLFELDQFTSLKEPYQ